MTKKKFVSYEVHMNFISMQTKSTAFQNCSNLQMLLADTSFDPTIGPDQSPIK